MREAATYHRTKNLKRPDLRAYALAAVAAVSLGDDTQDDSRETAFLRAHLEKAAGRQGWSSSLKRYVKKPAAGDLPLLHLAAEIGLSLAELLTVTLAAAVETDLMTGRALAHVQAPLGGSRPTLGLAGQAFAAVAEKGSSALEDMLTGAAVQSGLLTLLNEGAPVAERSVAVPLPLCLAMRGRASVWPGATVGQGHLPDVVLPESIVAEARRHAAALKPGGARALVVRSSSASEARSIACAIARSLERDALFIEGVAAAPGLVPWLILRKSMPVFCLEAGPGERKTLPALPYYRGPLIALCGPEGSVELAGEQVGSWTIDVPSRAERESLWLAAIGKRPLAEELARHHRHGSGRIAHLGRLARHRAALDGREEIERGDVVGASWAGEGSGLDALAQPLKEMVPEQALVTTPTLREELDRIYLRCLSRDGLADLLGVSSATRYRPGVRALFTGASGTGKTLAAGWLATRLGLPLYRVDLASITSKYIGETEKNLAQLMARAEHAEVVLLFDEADSLFARRTEVREANDRFANAQTNYLLQRIETFDGIVILTANSRARFDTAFARRLDAVLEFPLPGPEQRRDIWQSHLGERHALTVADLNQIAVAADLSGGNIRNAVLAAAVAARSEERAIGYADLVQGLAGEYRKLGRQMPVDLVRS